jgi:gliding motility-associated-like protein
MFIYITRLKNIFGCCVFLAAFIFCTPLFSQENCSNGIDDDGDGLIDCLDPDCNGWSVPLLTDFNTGSNNNGGILSAGSQDTRWRISYTGINGTYTPCRVLGAPATNPYTVSPWPNAQWISGNINASENPTALTTNPNGYTYHYRYDFNLPCDDSCRGNVSQNFCISMDFFADNAVMAIFVNGVMQPTVPNVNPANPGSYYGFRANNAATITLCNNWQPGLNSLVVRTFSGGGYQAFLAQVNPTSLINEPPVDPIITSQTDTLCLNGTPKQLSGTPANGIWTSSCPSCISASGIFTPNQTGNHFVTYANSAFPNCNKDTIWINVRPKPSIIVQNDTAVCMGQAITLAAQGAHTYNWNHGAVNGIPFVPTLTQTYLVEGADIYGCKNTAQVNVSVSNSLTSITAPDSLCLNSPSAQLTVNLSGGSWQSSCITCMDTSTGIFTPNMVGNHYVTYHPGIETCALDTVQIQVLPQPIITATASASNVCLGEGIILNASGAETYLWDEGVENNVLFYPTSNHTYTVIGSNEYGCENSTQIAVGVNSASLHISSLSDTLCLNAAGLQLTADSTGGVWSSSCTSCLDTLTGYFTPNTVGYFYVTYKHPNLQYCSTDTIYIKVAPLPVISTGGNVNVCAGESVILTATGALSYIWDNNVSNGIAFLPVSDQVYTVTGTNIFGCSATAQVRINIFPVYEFILQGKICPGQSFSFFNNNYHNPGHYQVILPSINGCDSTIQLQLTFHPSPIAGFNVPSQVDMANPEINVKDNSSLAETFDYYVNGVWVTNQPTFSFSATQEGSHTITQVVSNGLCIDSISHIVTTINTPNVFIPNTFTPNGDFNNGEWRPILTFIEEFELTVFSRWGEVIFESNDLYIGWNGGWFNDLQRPVKQDIYVYLIRYKQYKGPRKDLIGHINLIR